MSKDAMGFDPLGLDPVAIVQQATRQASQRAIEAYRHNIAVRGLYIADKDNPAVVGDPVGDDGKILTLEDRQRIAAGRKPYDPSTFGRRGPRLNGLVVSLDYDSDLKDRQVETVGATGQKAIDAQPEMRIVQPKVLPPYKAPKENDAPTSEDSNSPQPLPPFLD